MQVSERMTAKVHSCHPEDSLNSAAQRLWEHDCGSLPVVDDQGRVCGMITDRDICMAAYTTGLRLCDLKVREAMACAVASAHPEQSLREVELTMRNHGTRRLPVVDQGDFLLGMITCNDLIRWVDDGGSNGKLHHDAVHLVRTLAAIGKPRQLEPKPTGGTLSAQNLPPVPMAVPMRPHKEPALVSASAQHRDSV